MNPTWQSEDDSIQLYHGDCREILSALSVEKVDAVITDPPYGININKSQRLSISRGFGEDDWDTEKIDNDFLLNIISFAPVSVIWGGNYYELPSTRCVLVWDKKNDGRDFADIEMAWTNIDHVARIFRMRPQNMDGGKVHPTQKPVALMMWCIEQAKILTGGSMVIDPYMGVGSTGVACVKKGCKFIGIETKRKYFDIAVKRIENELAQLRMF